MDLLISLRILVPKYYWIAIIPMVFLNMFFMNLSVELDRLILSSLLVLIPALTYIAFHRYLGGINLPSKIRHYPWVYFCLSFTEEVRIRFVLYVALKVLIAYQGSYTTALWQVLAMITLLGIVYAGIVFAYLHRGNMSWSYYFIAHLYYLFAMVVSESVIVGVMAHALYNTVIEWYSRRLFSIL